MSPAAIGNRLRHLVAALPEPLQTQWQAVGFYGTRVGVPVGSSFVAIATAAYGDDDDDADDQAIAQYIATFSPPPILALAQLLEALPTMLAQATSESPPEDWLTAVADVRDAYRSLLEAWEGA